MHRSSESLAALATALAKAQAASRQPGKIADRDHPDRAARGGTAASAMRLSPAGSNRSQDARPA